MEKQITIHEPTEESFHDMSDIGAEDILDLSSIQREGASMSPAEPFLPSNVYVQDPDEPPMTISPTVYIQEPGEPPIISHRSFQHTPADPELSMSEIAPPSSTPLKKLCSECGAHVSKRNYLRHYKGHFDVNFRCKECSRYFETQEFLDLHNAKRHTQNHICAYCGKCYKQKSALNEHTRIKHEGSAKMVSCNICNKQFHRVGHLQDHLNTHFNRATHKCLKCKNAYHSYNSLKRHTQDCTGPAKSCGICKRTFSSRNTLADHEKSEHGGKVYACECGNTYKWRSGLARHKKMSNHGQ